METLTVCCHFQLSGILKPGLLIDMAVQPTNQSSPSASTKAAARASSPPKAASLASTSLEKPSPPVKIATARTSEVPTTELPTTEFPVAIPVAQTQVPVPVAKPVSRSSASAPIELPAKFSATATLQNASPATFELVNESDELDEFFEADSSFGSELLGRCKSWMTSMVIHLVVLIALALFSMNGKGRPEVTLEMYADDSGTMMALEEFEFESAASDLEENEQPVEQEVSEEVMQLSSEMDFLEDTFSDSLDTSDSLVGDPSSLAKASRDMSNDILSLQGGEASFFGIETRGDSIVYIVDRSGSMEGDRWRNATRELVKSIESLSPEQKFYVYLFSTSCHPMPRMRGTKSREMPFATKDNISRFKKWLFRQYPSGSTMPLAAIKRAIRQEPATIILLTDGQIYDETGTYLLNRALAQETVSDPDELVIHTIAFHCQVGLEMLMDVATAYDGTFRSVE